MACFFEYSVVKEERREFGQNYARVVEEGGRENYLWALKEILRAEGRSMAAQAQGDPPVYEAGLDDYKWLS